MARYRTQHPVLLWSGLTVAVLGLLLAVYAVTGTRKFHLAFFPVLLLGILTAVVGGAVAAYGRVAPTTRAEPLIPVDDDEPEPEPEPDAPVVMADVRCIRCDEEFTVEGQRPLHATCPNCGQAGRLPLD